MPTKFRKDGKEWGGSSSNKKSVVKRSYIKNIAKQELIEYINSSSGQPKVKAKCRNELTRRGVKLETVPQAETTQDFLARLK